MENLLPANAPQESISAVAQMGNGTGNCFSRCATAFRPRLSLFAVAGSAEGPGGAKSLALILPLATPVLEVFFSPAHSKQEGGVDWRATFVCGKGLELGEQERRGVSAPPVDGN